MASHKRQEVARRVSRIHGHVHAINDMLDSGRSYSEIVHQIVAVRSALDSVIQVIIDDMVEDCAVRAGENGKVAESLQELREVVSKLR